MITRSLFAIGIIILSTNAWAQVPSDAEIGKLLANRLAREDLGIGIVVGVIDSNGRRITLADLSTHSSGLPRMPANFNPKDDANPYADYTVQQLYDFLSNYKLTRDVGSQYEYSNLGAGLLGHVLSLRAGMSFENLVRSQICDPLGLSDTTVTLTPEMKRRLAVGISRLLP